MFVPDSNGRINYESAVNNVYEFVDDNATKFAFRLASAHLQQFLVGTLADPAGRRGRLSGYDENNDLVSDFNQNDNGMPDYLEPFVRYDVDPLEFLYGTDMNNNTVIDRFENDEEADYPYPRDHRGYNLYGGAEIKPGSRIMVGPHARVAAEQQSPQRGALRFADADARSAAPRFADAALQRPAPRQGQYPRRHHSVGAESRGTRGDYAPFADPMIAQDALINTTFLSARTRKYAPLIWRPS